MAVECSTAQDNVTGSSTGGQGHTGHDEPAAGSGDEGGVTRPHPLLSVPEHHSRSPLKRRSKKGHPFSMVDPSDLANMVDGGEDSLLRSLSVSEVVAKARGCLHPCTSLKLYKSIPLSLLQFGFDVVYPTQSELHLLERGQLTMLRSILGLPTRAPAYGLHYLLGTLPMQLLVYKKHLSLLHAILSLPDQATVKEVFLYRYHHSSAADRGFVSHILSILHELDLPSLPELLSSLPSKLAWKSHVKAMLYVRFQDLVLEAANHMPSLADVVNVPCNLRAKPINLVACFRGDVSLARLNNFRFRLLTHCPGLNKDTAVFHPRINRSRDPICDLCKSSVEDNRHFICDCPALQQVRDSWLPKLSVSSNDVLSHVLGGVWIKDTSFQRDIVCFLKDLRSLRLSLATSH